MTKSEARQWIKVMIANGVPLHPARARELYRLAELPTPPHLQKRTEPTGLEAELLKQLEEQVFQGQLEDRIAKTFEGVARDG